MSDDSQPLTILVVEDNPGDLFLLGEFLRSTDLVIGEVKHAGSLGEARQILPTEPLELVFLDLSLPDSFGLESYTGLQAYTQRIPVILLTGLSDTKLALHALVLGAQDYLGKGEFEEQLLSGAIRYSRERMRNLLNLRESEERYRELFNNNPMPMWVFDAKSFHFLEANGAAVLHYGYTHEEFLSMTLADIRVGGRRDDLLDEVASLRHIRDGVKKGIREHVTKNGQVIFVDIAWHSISYKDRPAVLVLAND